MHSWQKKRERKNILEITESLERKMNKLFKAILANGGCKEKMVLSQYLCCKNKINIIFNCNVKVPIIIPWIMVFLSIYLVLTPIIANPRLEFVYSLAFIAIGIVAYIPFVRYGVALPGTGTSAFSID